MFGKLAVEATAEFEKFAEEIQKWILENPQVLSGEQRIIKVSRGEGYVAEVKISMRTLNKETCMYPNGKIDIDLKKFKSIFKELNKATNIYTKKAEDILLESLQNVLQFSSISDKLEYEVGREGGVSVKFTIMI